MRDSVYIKIENSRVDPETGESISISLTSNIKKDFGETEVTEEKIKEELNTLEGLILSQLDNQNKEIISPKPLKKKEKTTKKKSSTFSNLLKK